MRISDWSSDLFSSDLLTGEHEGYYANYADQPAQKLARVLAEGFAYQGEPMPSPDHRPRGTQSTQLPSTAFVFFLQNHDQIGNRAFGQRLIEQIGRARVGKECVSTCRSRWSQYH